MPKYKASTIFKSETTVSKGVRMTDIVAFRRKERETGKVRLRLRPLLPLLVDYAIEEALKDVGNDSVVKIILEKT